MPSLLDLSDDTICSLAHMANGDNDIPFPSFGPHWRKNSHSQIDPAHSSSILALRATCRRLRGMIGHKGLYMRVTRWESMTRHMAHTPVSVLQGVRRLEIDISRPVPRALVSAWAVLTTFLSFLSNLEELVILELSLCRHPREDPEENSADLCTYTESLRLSPALQLSPKLAALCVACKCYACAGVYVSNFAPTARDLTHLRAPELGVYDEDNDIADLWSDDWESKFPGMELPLRTLRTGIDGLSSSIEDIDKDEEFDSFSEVSEIHLAPIVYYNSHAIATEPLVILFEAITSAFPNLTYFDAALEVIAISPEEYEASVSTQQWLPPPPNPSDDGHRQPPKYKITSRIPQLVAAATLLLQHIPSLERGVFWERANPPGGERWYRWSWELREQGDGTTVPVILKDPELVLPMRSEEGDMFEVAEQAMNGVWE
ncbi:hypothetical protein IAT38_002397 [Cryptococcus sp. DSM 104549]